MRSESDLGRPRHTTIVARNLRSAATIETPLEIGTRLECGQQDLAAPEVVSGERERLSLRITVRGAYDIDAIGW
jgi:hypothetical protein